MPSEEEQSPELKVAGTISEVAAQILSQSFAVYRVDATTAANIRTARRAAFKFFGETSSAPSEELDQKACTSNQENVLVKRYRRIVDGDLYGYNVPLPTKELFRTWHHPRSSGKRQEEHKKGRSLEETRFRQQQPWPSSELYTGSFRLAENLHQMLLECLKQVLLTVSSQRLDGIRGTNSNDNSHRNSKAQRKNAASCSSRPRKRIRSSSCDSEDPEKSEKGSENNTLPIRSGSCPLDYFFYHNRVPHAINCSEHIDRGALVVVCLTDVPGLEVCCLPSSNEALLSFRCPENLVAQFRKNSTDNGSSDLVCIMAGDQLSRLLPENHAPPSCIHRVRNVLERPRLSISYELRLNDV